MEISSGKTEDTHKIIWQHPFLQTSLISPGYCGPDLLKQFFQLPWQDLSWQENDFVFSIPAYGEVVTFPLLLSCPALPFVVTSLPPSPPLGGGQFSSPLLVQQSLPIPEPHRFCVLIFLPFISYSLLFFSHYCWCLPELLGPSGPASSLVCFGALGRSPDHRPRCLEWFGLFCHQACDPKTLIELSKRKQMCIYQTSRSIWNIWVFTKCSPCSGT